MERLLRILEKTHRKSSLDRMLFTATEFKSRGQAFDSYLLLFDDISVVEGVNYSHYASIEYSFIHVKGGLLFLHTCQGGIKQVP